MCRKLCKEVLEEHFKVPFKRTMIDGFIIDYYNKDLKIGIVYNSIHCYLYSPKFHKTYRKFTADMNRSKARWETCRLAGIKLATIPYHVKCITGRVRNSFEIPNDCQCHDCLT